MSAERPVPSPQPTALKGCTYGLAAIAVLAALALLAWRQSDGHTWEELAVNAPGNAKVALVKARRCSAGTCRTLWIGPTRDAAALVGTLAAASERVDEIVWTRDGMRVAFLVNGYQLRLYDADTLSPAGQFSLITPDGSPSPRIARGVTFSENGRAVTFDDCPRAHSGCRAGLVAVPR